MKKTRALPLIIAMGLIVTVIAPGANAESIDLKKEVTYLLNSVAIPQAILNQCCSGKNIKQYPGVILNYDQNLLDLSDMTWNVTSTDLNKTMQAETSVVSTASMVNCDPDNENEADKEVGWDKSSSSTIDLEESIDVSAGMTVVGKDEILGTGVDIKVSMEVDYGMAITEGQEWESAVSGSDTMHATLPPNSYVPIECTLTTFTVDNEKYPITLTVSGKVTLPAVNYTFKNGPAGKVPGFTFKIEDVTTAAERSVTTSVTLNGSAYSDKVTCVDKAPVTMDAQDRKTQGCGS